MVQFNTRANEILLKLVYYGPGLSGKTTNLQALHAMCNEASRGEMFSVNTQEDRTLFFDLLPINLGYIYGNAIHLQIYTVPGQVQYDASRRVVLGGADGVVFVADSSEAKMQENVDSLSNLYHNLNANRLNIKQIPFVIQYNKRDLADAMPVGVMNRRLNFRSVPFFEAVAPRGIGVLDTFLSITKDTVGTTFRKYHLDKKIKDFDEMLNLIETNIRSSMRELAPPEAPEAAPAPPESTVIRHSDVSVAELTAGKVADAQELLEDALKSNMETARLYSELKQVKDSLEKKNEEVNQLYAQLERANQDNLKTRRYLEGLIQSVGEAIISFSHDGRILTWNSAAEQIFGYARSEIVGHSIRQLLPAHCEGELDQVVTQVGKGQTLRDIQTFRLRKDRSEFPASVTYAPIRGGDDRVLAFSALTRDMGSQKALELRVETLESGTSLSRIMPPIFNELANRLSPILLQKGMLIEETTDPRQAARFGKLLQAVDSAQNLLKPLLMVVTPSSPRLEAGQLNRVIQEAVKRVEPEAAAAGVSMDSSLDPSLPDTGLDADQVREALVNLLRSGIYAASHASVRRVRIGTRAIPGGAQLVCQDTGAAIPEPEKGEVFELAHVSDVAMLGPCVAASVVRAHGGRISVRSQEGAGNAFLLEFPMIDGAASPAAPASLQGKKVLVVDDEAFLLECLVDAISAWGCEATPCPLAADAIQKLESGKYDLIVSDIRMPGLSGIQLFSWIQEHQPEMTRRVLYTTGDSFDPETREFLDRSRLPNLGKPFDLKRLKQALGDLLQSVEG
jgi:PAS domain S-box-containing protein